MVIRLRLTSANTPLSPAESERQALRLSARRVGAATAGWLGHIRGLETVSKLSGIFFNLVLPCLTLFAGVFTLFSPCFHLD